MARGVSQIGFSVSVSVSVRVSVSVSVSVSVNVRVSVHLDALRGLRRHGRRRQRRREGEGGEGPVGGQPGCLEEEGVVDAGQHRLLIEREFFIDNLLVRIYLTIVIVRWTGLAPWNFSPSPDVHRVSSSLSGPVDPSFRALSGRPKLTVRRHKFNQYSLPRKHRLLSTVKSSYSRLIGTTTAQQKCRRTAQQKCGAVPRRARI